MVKVPLLAVVAASAYAAPTTLVEEHPIKIVRDESGVYIVDFGRVAFGNVRLTPHAGMEGSEVEVHFGEDLKAGRVNRTPPGTVRYSHAKVRLADSAVVVAPSADKRNTNVKKNAVLTPKEWGVVLPFRWVEVEGWSGDLKTEDITRRSAYLSAWDDGAAAFECSNEMLNRIWELCRYSIKATTFAGVYVDGDRERIPYEADAYLNQLSHYYADNDIQMARDTFDYLMRYPTWPTEWAPHMVFMAYADYLHTGDVKWLKPRYEALKNKLLMERRGTDALVASGDRDIKRNDIVDWPKGERDAYVFTARNTVVNAFHFRALRRMAILAQAVGQSDDAQAYGMQCVESYAAFQKAFYDPKQNLYTDGVATDHCSLHANLFPLAFKLVPEERCAAVAEWLTGRGMACSVYAAQYLMEALFENGQGEAAVGLMVAEGDRSWKHMVESRATLTWEAWDLKYKPNQDWNHAWGAAPANLLPRYVLGVEALQPGWGEARIRPCPSGLDFARGKVPTPLGPVYVQWEQADQFALSLELPAEMKLRLELPAPESSTGVLMNGRPVAAKRSGDRWILSPAIKGKTRFVVKHD